MKTLLFKAILNSFDFFGRKFVYNKDLPGEVACINNISYSSRSKINELDIHFPKDNTQKLPILVYIHGGGWTIGDKASYTKFCETIAKEGFLVFNINYRLGPKYKHPSQVIDVNDALTWVIENAASYNGNIQQVFLGGDSAGAHLASLQGCLITNENLRNYYNIEIPINKSHLSGLILYYGAYNFDTLIDTRFPGIKIMTNSYIGTRNPKEYKYVKKISPIHNITEDFPPVFITSGKVDWLYSQTIEMIKELDNKGINHTDLLFDEETKEAQHAFINFYKRDCTKKACQYTIDFLKEKSKVKIKNPIKI